MKLRPFSLHSTSTLSGASTSDEQSQIAQLLQSITANIDTVTKHRAQIAAVRAFLASNPPADERPYAEQEWHQLLDMTENVELAAIEKARRTAQQLATYLMVASHMPSNVSTKLRAKGDSLLNHIDALQSTWHNFNPASATESPESVGHLVHISALLKEMPPMLDGWIFVDSKQASKFAAFFPTAGGESGPVKGFIKAPSDPTTALLPAQICRNLSPALQAWYAKDNSDCTTLPPPVLAGVARCSITGKGYDAASDSCFSLPGSGDESSGGNGGSGDHKEPSGGGDSEEKKETSYVPWLVGAAAVIAGLGWYATRKTK